MSRDLTKIDKGIFKTLKKNHILSYWNKKNSHHIHVHIIFKNLFDKFEKFSPKCINEFSDVNI